MNRRGFLKLLGVGAALAAFPPLRRVMPKTIQEMIDEVGPGGGVVYLPSGVYTITTRLYLSSGVKVIGA